MDPYDLLRYDPRKSTINNKKSELIVSSKKIKDCSQVIDTLSKSGIIFSVLESTIVNYRNREKIKEKGCSIIMDYIEPEQVEKFVWKSLQKAYDLDTAQMIIKKKTFFGY